MEDEGRKIKVEVDILQYLKYFRPAHKCIITRLSLSIHTSPHRQAHLRIIIFCAICFLLHPPSLMMSDA